MGIHNQKLEDSYVFKCDACESSFEKSTKECRRTNGKSKTFDFVRLDTKCPYCTSNAYTLILPKDVVIPYGD